MRSFQSTLAFSDFCSKKQQDVRSSRRTAFLYQEKVKKRERRGNLRLCLKGPACTPQLLLHTPTHADLAVNEPVRGAAALITSNSSSQGTCLSR